MTHQTIKDVTDRITARSTKSREAYLIKLEAMRKDGRSRGMMSCGNLAHAMASCPQSQKDSLSSDVVANIAIVSAYNDMLSAHQPYHHYLDEVKASVARAGGVAQMAGGVPAMCDGVTQGQPGMEMSLFSREVIALSTALAMSHNVFDGGLLFGICDKIVPGLLIGALSFGHLPFGFVPSGPMPTGISNSEKASVRQEFAAGNVGERELLLSESRAYHSPGTCTFYGTANTNQVMLEVMGLQLPGSSFVPPNSPLRSALNDEAAKVVTSNASEGVAALGDLVDASAIVNGIVGLLATGGSTNHTLHIPAIAAAAGLHVTWQDFSDLSQVVPLIARVYPNGPADVNAFHKAGGTSFVLSELLAAGLVNEQAATILNRPLTEYALQPAYENETLGFSAAARTSGDDTILARVDKPFQKNGGLAVLKGNLGEAIMKTSAVKDNQRSIEAPALVFHSQEEFLEAFEKGNLEKDFVAVLRFQGPKSNGMPELHKLTPPLGLLQDKGFKVALVTDGRMSGASGKIPAAIHVSPEAASGGPIGLIETGDTITLDAATGTLNVKADLTGRVPAAGPAAQPTYGRDLFDGFRNLVGHAESGASIFQLTKSEA